MAVAGVAQFAMFVVVAAAAVVWWTLGASERVTMLIALALATVVAGGLLLASAMAWSDPRPFVVDGTAPMFPHADDNGFPSDHTIASTLVAGVVTAFRLRVGLILLVTSILLGVARVAARVHHVPDVIAGLIIGLAAAALGVALARVGVAGSRGWRRSWQRADRPAA